MEPTLNNPITIIQDFVRNGLQATNELIINELYCDIPLVQEVAKHLISNGGKRIRPLLVLLTAEALAYTGNDHIPLSTIIEFIHTASLLHDDVIDEAALRRGKVSANKVWGNSATILVGDFLYSRAFQLTAQLNNLAINQLLSKATNELAQGEIFQLIHANNPNITEEQYFETIRRKTAYLFAAAAQSTAVLANASLEQQQALYHYGLNLGIAFQLTDDLLDYQGEKTELGKQIGQDLSEGKLTLPLIIALKEATPEEATFLRKALLEKNTSAIERIISILQSTGSIDFTEKLSKKYVSQALHNLEALPKSRYCDALAKLAQFCQSRRY